MKIVAVIGPYRAPTAWQRELNIQNARRLGAEVAVLGAMPFVPHASTAHMDGLMTDIFWLYGTRELVSRCDAGILVDGWQLSLGSHGEIDVLRQQGKPVFEKLSQLEAWLSTEP